MEQQYKGYPFDQRITNYLQNLKKLVSKSDYKLVEKYHQQMILTSMKKATISKNLEVIKSLSEILDHKKSWAKMTKSDINWLVSQVMSKYAGNNNEETHSTYDHKKILKMWFRFVKTGNRNHKKTGTPEELRDIEMTQVKSKITNSDLITREELRLILNHCSNDRDRALFEVLYEAGMRISEILSIQRKHVTSNQHGFILKIPQSKTEIRELALVTSNDALGKWWNNHPRKDDPEAALFCKIQQGVIGDFITEPTVNRILKRICKKVGIKKRIYPHLFRHTSATEYVPRLGYHANDRYGWSENSKMKSHYVSLNQAQKNNAYYSLHGISNEENTLRQNKVCPTCKHANSPEADLCSNCQRALTLEARIQLEEQSKESESNIQSDVKVLAEQIGVIKQYLQMLQLNPNKKTSVDDVLPIDSIPEKFKEPIMTFLQQK